MSAGARGWHWIERDLAEGDGLPASLLREELARLEGLLRNHAEFERLFPEKEA